MRIRKRGDVLIGLVALAVAGLWAVGMGPAAGASSSSGSVFAYGGATAYGAPPSAALAAPVVAVASTVDGKGYWLLGADGGVFNYGDAPFYGSRGASGVFRPSVGIAPTPDGRGYWIATDSGLVDDFGDAPPEGPAAVFPGAPVIGIATASAAGYWLAGADGGVFSFGNAPFYGSLGGRALNAPIVAVASTPDRRGYWLVAADGGVFSFGDAPFLGSLAGRALNAPIVGMASTPDRRGYWLVAADGGVFSFGDAPFHGSLGATPPSSATPVTAIAAQPSGAGYWLTTTDKPLPPPTAVPAVVDQCNQAAPRPDVKPTSIVLACGDGNAVLTHLTWSSWTATAATGSGFFTHNTCTPDCARGTFVSAPATIKLSYPIQTSAGKEFGSISYSYSNPSAPSGRTTITVVAPTSPG